MTDRHEPLFFVRVKPSEGGDSRIDMTGRITSFEYEDNERAADKLTISIDNWDLSNFDDPVWKKGNILEISWGYPDTMALPRTVQIREVKGFNPLRVEAHGKEVIANRVVKNRVFENTKRSDVVRTIANELGYRDDDALHIQDTEIVYETIAQAGLTDAQFIRRLAHKEGFQWYVDFDGFHFHERDLTQDALRVYTYYNINEKQGDILSIDITNDVTARPGRVKTKGRDPENRADVDGDASNTKDNKRGVLSERIEVIDPETGESLGFKEIGQESTSATSEESNSAASRRAAAKFRGIQQVAVKLNMTVVGDATLVAKSVFQLENVGKRLSQRYYIRKVVHTIDSSGYTSQIESISDGSGGHSTKSIHAPELTAVQVAPSTDGKRAAAITAAAVALTQAHSYAKQHQLSPPSLTAQKVGDHYVFLDTQGRRVPPEAAARTIQSEISRVHQESIDDAEEEE